MSDEKRKARVLDAKRKEQRLINAYHRVFDSKEGKLVLEDLQGLFRLRQRVFTPISKGTHHAYDPLTAALADGARGVVIYIDERLAQSAKADGNIEEGTEKVIR